MSESKFTPGPWVRDSRNSVRTEDNRKVASADSYGRSWAEKKANSTLVAAAPDLLADLALAAATLRRYEQSHRAKGTEESTAKAEVNAELATRFEATILKATA